MARPLDHSHSTGFQSSKPRPARAMSICATRLLAIALTTVSATQKPTSNQRGWRQ
jgi:hypothetical protein